MKCPADQNEMVKELYEDSVEVDRCSECNGVWLDKGELEKIQETIKNDYKEDLEQPKNILRSVKSMAIAKKEQPIRCAECDCTMERKEYAYTSMIMVDVCPLCQGIFLDHGEIKALEVFFERNLKANEEENQGFFKKLGKLLAS